VYLSFLGKTTYITARRSFCECAAAFWFSLLADSVSSSTVRVLLLLLFVPFHPLGKNTHGSAFCACCSLKVRTLMRSVAELKKKLILTTAQGKDHRRSAMIRAMRTRLREQVSPTLSSKCSHTRPLRASLRYVLED